MHDLVSIVAPMRRDADIELLSRFLEKLECFPDKREIILVCSNMSSESQVELIKMMEDVPDTTIHFLSDGASFDISALIGMDNCLGAVCIIADINDDIVSLLPKLIEKREEGFDFVSIEVPSEKLPRHGSRVYSLLRQAYFRLFRGLSGLTIDPALARTRLLTRAASRYLLTRRDAEMLLRTKVFASGFPSTSIVAEATVALSEPSLSGGLTKAYRSLKNSFALPVRIIVWFALAAASINLLYSFYVFGVFLFSQNVAPGWTTMSLQLSIGFFVMSIMFAFLGELLVSIERGVNYRMRYYIQREVRSKKSNLNKLRNLDFGTIESVLDQKQVSQ